MPMLLMICPNLDAVIGFRAGVVHESDHARAPDRNTTNSSPEFDDQG